MGCGIYVIFKKDVEITRLGLLRRGVLDSKIVHPKGILGISDFLGRRVSIPFVDRLKGRFGGLFNSQGISGVLAVRTSKVNVTYLATICFKIPIIFTGGSTKDGVSGRVFTARIVSCARGQGGRIIMSGGCLGPNRRVLVVSSFLTGNYTIDKLLSLMGRTSNVIRNVNVYVRGNFRNNNSTLHRTKCSIHSLTIVRGVSTRANIVAFH